MEKLRSIPLNFLGLLLVFWPSWYWYAIRTFDGSDEPCGILALITVVVFAITKAEKTKTPLRAGTLIACAVLLSCYCVSLWLAPPLVRFMIAACTVGLMLFQHCAKDKRNVIALFGLIILSSPLVASLQFFLGFPSRLLVTQLSAFVLRAGGAIVTSSGTFFELQNKMIVVDAPCSGIKMLWAGLYLCFVLCWLKQLSVRHSILLMLVSVLGVFITNVERTLCLFYVEKLASEGNTLPQNLHDLIGVSGFIVLAVLIYCLASWLSKRQVVVGALKEMDSGDEGRSKNCPSVPVMIGRFPQAAFVSLCMLAAVITVFHRVQGPGSQLPGDELSFEWPSEFEGCPLSRLELTPEESKFAVSFPGHVGKFSDGQREILYRYVNRPTRQLHPSSDCFKGSNFRITPLPAVRDRYGRVWSRFSASRDEKLLEVREIVVDANDNHKTWSDISAWYWSAVAAPRDSIWVAITVVKVTPD